MLSPPIGQIIESAVALLREHNSTAAVRYLREVVGDVADWSDTSEYAELAALWSKCEREQRNHLQAHAMAATCLSIILPKLKAESTPYRKILLDILLYHHNVGPYDGNLKALCEAAGVRLSELGDNGGVFVIETILASLSYAQDDITEAKHHATSAAQLIEAAEESAPITPNDFGFAIAKLAFDLYYGKEDWQNAKIFADIATPFIDDASFEELRGHIFLRLNEPEPALQAYDAAWRKGERRAALLTNRAAAMRMARRFDDARTILVEGLLQHPHDGRLRLQLASLHFELGHFEEVVGVCSAALGEHVPVQPMHVNGGSQRMSPAAYFRSLGEGQLLTELRLLRMQALGRVDSRDSLLSGNVIQDCFLGGSLGGYGSVGFE